MFASIDPSDTEEDLVSETEGRSAHLLAFAVGALVGIAIASIWIPEPRNRLPRVVRRRYQRVREAGGAALDELREASREITGEFREELGTTLEAAREELSDMARQQLENVRDALGRERKRVFRR
jgi:uncharacterized membrane protein YccC